MLPAPPQWQPRRTARAPPPRGGIVRRNSRDLWRETVDRNGFGDVSPPPSLRRSTAANWTGTCGLGRRPPRGGNGGRNRENRIVAPCTSLDVLGESGLPGVAYRRSAEASASSFCKGNNKKRARPTEETPGPMHDFARLAGRRRDLDHSRRKPPVVKSFRKVAEASRRRLFSDDRTPMQ